MPENGHAEVALWAVNTWSASLAESIETMAGEKPAVSAQEAGTGAPSDGVLWWEQPFNLGPQAMAWIGAPEATWLAIGRHILASAGIEATEPADARNTYLEIISQALSGLCQAASGRLGVPVSCENGAETTGAPPVEGQYEISVAIGAETLLVYVALSPVLILAFAQDPGALELRKSHRQEVAEQYPEVPEHSDGLHGIQKDSKTLDLLMEVELPVSVSFGRAELALKDVLKLTTGSIVELNRALNEPVEVIVNNCVIARGEVVVIEGNYGVRIHEIVSRDSRLRALP